MPLWILVALWFCWTLYSAVELHYYITARVYTQGAVNFTVLWVAVSVFWICWNIWG